MTKVLLTLHCASADAEGIGEALRGISTAPIHLREETVLGTDFGDAGAGEQVTGRLRRTALEILCEDALMDDLIGAAGKARRRLPFRWNAIAIHASGRMP